ncbi:MAG: hypothetical protein HXX10_13710 [Rhodoplanes sp.]|uniref:hypothetical protein n=1 Tax=Rhodoplanes sp. TaxID=1968906 RepID=UPI0018189201|nr:hypothetical protein [Rhodoplanes sp.]NVO15086.1 hypothetical protein [Rhodoplanes sp.]
MSDEPTVGPRRTVWIWVIFLWFLFSVGWTLLSFYLIRSGVVPVEPVQQAYFDRLTIVDYASTVLVAALNLAGALALFMLRKAALPIFLTGIVLSVGLIAWQTYSKGWAEALGGSGLVGAVIGYGLILAICTYTWRLARRGVLQ